MSELKQCETCTHFDNGWCMRQSSAERAKFERWQGKCRVSAIYYQPAEPTIEQLEAAFGDGLDDRQPKSSLVDAFILTGKEGGVI